MAYSTSLEFLVQNTYANVTYLKFISCRKDSGYQDLLKRIKRIGFFSVFLYACISLFVCLLTSLTSAITFEPQNIYTTVHQFFCILHFTFIFLMYTPLMISFQKSKVNIILILIFNLLLKIFYGMLPPRCTVF